MRWARLSILAGTLVAAAGLLAWALIGRLEWSEREVWTGYTGEASYNDFLACQRLLERMGQRASSIRGLPAGKRMPARNDVVLLPMRRERITPGQAEALMGWVARGGLLVTEGLTAESREAAVTQDPVCRAVGARLAWVPEWNGGGLAPGKMTVDPKAFDEANRNVQVVIDGRGYTVRLGAWRQLLDLGGRAARSAGNASGIKLLQYDLGRGRVVLCTDLSCLANGNLAEADHAGFVSALVQGWGPGNRVWIVYREEAPSLRRWLGDHAWRVLGALAALLAAGLWNAAPRFGPLVPDPHEPRRSLLEHLAACGRFQWARRGGLPLLAAARQAALARVHRAHPSWGHLDSGALCDRLAGVTGLAAENIDRALHQASIPDPREFTEAIRTLELIRKRT
ncbi:MAG TPA: DUF4350 domain-containing protein [Holophaga sp.]|nr:DUF4350 domain-containing protein [Holophaga sp.]